LYIPFPEAALENRIIASQVPEIDEQLRQQLVSFVHDLRDMSLKKVPAVSEVIDWARALLLLNVKDLDVGWLTQTLNLLLKFQEDIDLVQPEVRRMIKEKR
jgi:MoxR-like ATPase